MQRAGSPSTPPDGGAAACIPRQPTPGRGASRRRLLSSCCSTPRPPRPPIRGPSYPTIFYDAPAGRVVAHSDWTPNGTMFDYKASWESINHQNATGGQFELFRKGEWLTKEMSNYDNNAQWTDHHLPQHPGAPELVRRRHSRQPELVTRSASGPTAASGCGACRGRSHHRHQQRPRLRVCGQRPDRHVQPAPRLAARQRRMDVTQATRSVVWLNSDYVVVYDRVHRAPGLFKRFNLSLVNAPVTLTANVTATDTLDGRHSCSSRRCCRSERGHTVFNGGGAVSTPSRSWSRPSTFTRCRTRPTPPDTRFLHVLQGADRARRWWRRRTCKAPRAPRLTARYSAPGRVLPGERQHRIRRRHAARAVRSSYRDGDGIDAQCRLHHQRRAEWRDHLTRRPHHGR